MAEDSTEQATAQDIEKKISPAALKKLIKELRSKQNDIDHLSGQMGNAVEKATEKVHLNKKAFGWIRQLDRMPAEKLAIFIDDFEYMLDASGLSDRAKSVQRMPLEEQSDGAEEGRSSSKVRPFPAPAAVNGG